VNQKLKLRVIKVGLETGRRSYQFERDLDFWAGKISKIIAGIVEPTETEKSDLAKALNCRVEDIFPHEPVETA